MNSSLVFHIDEAYEFPLTMHGPFTPSTLPLRYCTLIGLLNIFLLVLAVFLVATVSSPKMGAYKFLLIQIAASSYATEMYSFLFLPVFCMPMPAGYSISPIPLSGIAPHLGMTFWVACACNVMYSLLDGFNYRFGVIYRTFKADNWISANPWRLALLHRFIGLIYVGSFALLGAFTTREDMRKYIMEFYPLTLPVFDKEPSFRVYTQTVTPGITPIMVAFVAGISVMTGEAVIYISWSHLLLKARAGAMSAKTRSMHVAYINQLLLQAAIPFVFLVLPKLLVLMLTLFRLGGSTNMGGLVTTYMAPLHSAFTSLSFALGNSSYRKRMASFNCCGTFLRQKNNAIIAASFSSHPSREDNITNVK